MIRNQLAKHLGFVTRKGRGPFLVVKECRDVSPRSGSDWTDEVATQFPHLSKPQAAVLALWSFGIVLARSCTLPAVANILSPLIGRCYNTVRQRLREWVKEGTEKWKRTAQRT